MWRFATPFQGVPPEWQVTGHEGFRAPGDKGGTP